LNNREAAVEILKRIALSIENGDSSAVKELTKKAIEQNISPEDILNNSLIKGMNVVGKKFKENEIFIPEVLIAARAMKAGLDILKPSLAGAKTGFKGKVLLATVKGDIHDIGKKIVGLRLEGAGYEVIDIGVDITKDRLLAVFKKERPAVVGLSALLTTTMSYMREVIETFESAKFRRNVRIIIGGAAVTQSYANEIRADGYASDADSAVALVRSLVR
jgi:5-methyltetrahydrofolate--homocysteine methyltransferase